MLFILSFTCFVIIALIIAIVFEEKKNSRNGMFIPVFGIYISIYILLLPLALAQATDFPYAKTLTWTMQIIGLNKDFVDVYEVLGQANLPGWFVLIYDFSLVVLYALAPLITVASIALRLVRGFFSRWRWFTNSNKETWFFSEPSEKALIFAKNAMDEEKLNIIFCNVTEDDYEKILSMGAIPFTKGLAALKDWYFRRFHSSVFFMTEDEEKNLEEAIDFAKNDHLKQFRRTEADESAVDILVYVFTSRPEAELLLNDSDIKKTFKEKGILCRRIAENRAGVYRELMDFGKNIEDRLASRHRLDLLLLGCGWIGSEILDLFIWMYSREDNKLHIVVVDKEDRAKEFACSHPGFVTRQERGRAYFTLKEDNMSPGGTGSDNFLVEFVSCDDVFCAEWDKICDLENIDLAYIALGNDNKNLECAIRLRRQLNYHRRLTERRNAEIPAEISGINSVPWIRVVLKNPMSKKLNLQDVKHQPYCIDAFLSESNYFTIKTVLNYELEKWALAEEFRYETSIKQSREKNGNEPFVLRQRALFSKMVEIRTNASLPDLEMDVEKASDPRELHKACEKLKAYNNEKNSPDTDEGRIGTYAQWRSFLLNKKMIRTAENFYSYDYNSCASRAAALYKLQNVSHAHDLLKEIWESDGPSDSFDHEKEIWERIQREEHWRWNMYMFTRGYHHNGDCPADGFKEKMIQRDDIARIHPNIIPYEDLESGTKEKDGF